MSSKALEMHIIEFLNLKRSSPEVRTHMTYGKKLEVFYNYLIDEKDISEQNYISVLEQLSINDIISSINYYKKNNNVKYQSTINNYLSVLHEFFKFLLENYKMRNECFEENSKEKVLREECDEFVKEHFSPTEKAKELDEKLVRELIQKCNESISAGENKCIADLRIKDGTYTEYVSALVVKLVLLTGLKNSKVLSLEFSQYNWDLNEITIGEFQVRLPNGLAIQMKKYKEVRSGISNLDDKKALLFTGINGATLDNATAFQAMMPITGDRKATSVVKYAIIQMLKGGMPLSLVMRFTGNKDDICGYCQEYIEEESDEFLLRNKKLDIVLRNSDAFDLL